MTGAAETCASCMWSREMPEPNVWPADAIALPAIRCVRFPQAVVNAPTYWCGEFLPKEVHT